MVPSAGGGTVQIVFDPELGRDVFSFSNGGWLEVQDLYGLLKNMGSEEMTIEVCVKTLDAATYMCGDQPLPIMYPVPDQMILQKGDFIGNSNYYLNFGWGRDDMRKEYCDPFGYFPGFGWNYGTSTEGVYSPPDPTLTAGWKVFSIRITQEDFSVPWMPGAKVAWAHTNRNTNPYPATYIPAEVDTRAIASAGAPLMIGNGRPTNGTNGFNPNPFFGRIDYIRIYKGLLPIEQLNDNPTNPVPDMPPTNSPPVALCTDISIPADANCQALVTAAVLDGGSYDPDGDPITLSIDQTGPLTAGPAGEAVYPITLTAAENKPGGLSASCTAQVKVVDATAPVPTLSEPVCGKDAKGKMAVKLTAGATDGCSSGVVPTIDAVVVVNSGGQPVRGKGVYEIVGSDIFVYPNGKGWSVSVTITAVDAKKNPRTETIVKKIDKC